MESEQSEAKDETVNDLERSEVVTNPIQERMEVLREMVLVGYKVERKDLNLFLKKGEERFILRIHQCSAGRSWGARSEQDSRLEVKISKNSDPLPQGTVIHFCNRFLSSSFPRILSGGTETWIQMSDYMLRDIRSGLESVDIETVYSIVFSNIIFSYIEHVGNESGRRISIQRSVLVCAY